MEKDNQADSEENELAKVYSYLNIAKKLYQKETNRNLIKDIINYNPTENFQKVPNETPYIDADLEQLVSFHLHSVRYTVELGIIDGSSVKLMVNSLPNKAEDIVDNLYNSDGIIKICPTGTKSTFAVPVENVTSISVHEETADNE